MATVARNQGALSQIAQHRGLFSLGFVAVFGLSLAFLAAVGATPNPLTTAGQSQPVQSNTPVTLSGSGEEPVRIVATDINLDARVNIPASSDVDVMNNALLTGAAWYPNSAQLGTEGTVILFGHSSYLPVVHNQAYKTFDGVQNLKEGDIVSVYSSDTEYRYKVTGVKVADATQDVIDLPPQGEHLVLVTCDSFASKENRFVVTADFVGAYALSS